MKRILSLILAIALVATFVPTAFAADPEDNTNNGNGNEWIFNLASHGLTEECSLAPDNVTPFTLDTTDADISDKWEYVNQASSSTRNVTKDYIYWTKRNQSNVPVFNPDDNSTTNAIIFELVPDTSGTFYPNISYISGTASAMYDVYFFEKPHDTWKVSSTMIDGFRTVRSGITAYIKNNPSVYVGNFDAYGDGTLKVAGFPKVTVTSGKSYYLVLIANGRNEAWEPASASNPTIEMNLVSFSLKNQDVTASPFYEYKIKRSSLSDTFYTDYASTLSSYSNLPSNGMLKFISWETTVSGVAVPAIDTAKTDGFATTGRNNRLDTSPGLYDDGFGSAVRIGTYSTETATASFNHGDAMGTRGFCLIKVNVPYGGKYKLTALNAFTSETAERTFSRSSNADNAVVEGAVPTVHMVKATVAPQTDHATNNYVVNVGSMGFSEDTAIGSYDSGKLTTDADNPIRTDVGTVELDSGVYYVLFDFDSASITANPKYWNHSNSLYQLFLLSGIELTPVDKNDYDAIQSEYDEIANVNTGNAEEEAPANTTSNVKILCSVDESVLNTMEAEAGAPVTYEAPLKDGYTFLYWAQGIGEYKKIISYDAKLSIKAEKGPMWLTAVYSDNNATKTDVVFYNANGDEISRSQYNENDAITLPALPSMAGFETATGWTLDKDGITYTAADEVKASGRLMRFVAEYADEPSESFDITVVDGTADNAAPVYGETVTVMATPRNGTKLFNYWEKDGEIVSFDLSYSFKAYKDTTVTAVYKDYLPVADAVRKIIIGTRTVGNEIAAVAEFIGVSDVVEKGILFGESLDNATHKIAMKTDGDTFSVIDDVAGDAIGYAILANGNVIYSK